LEGWQSPRLAARPSPFQLQPLRLKFLERPNLIAQGNTKPLARFMLYHLSLQGLRSFLRGKVPSIRRLSPPSLNFVAPETS